MNFQYISTACTGIHISYLQLITYIVCSAYIYAVVNDVITLFDNHIFLYQKYNIAPMFVNKLPIAQWETGG